MKYGMRLTRTSASFKAQFCKSLGLPINTKASKMLEVIGYIYADNGMEQKFIDTCSKFGLEVSFQNK
jgi:hypothetical protein